MKDLTARTRRLVVTVLVPILLAATPGVASSALGAVGERSGAATVARWSAVAVPQGAAPSNEPLMMAWGVNAGTAYHYFEAVNTGDLTLTSLTLDVHHTTSGGNSTNRTITLEWCRAGHWVADTHTCSGTLVPLGTTSATLRTKLETTLPPDTRLQLRARTSPNNQGNVTVVSVSVHRAAARPTEITDR